MPYDMMHQSKGVFFFFFFAQETAILNSIHFYTAFSVPPLCCLEKTATEEIPQSSFPFLLGEHSLPLCITDCRKVCSDVFFYYYFPCSHFQCWQQLDHPTMQQHSKCQQQLISISLSITAHLCSSRHLHCPIKKLLSRMAACKQLMKWGHQPRKNFGFLDIQ